MWFLTMLLEVFNTSCCFVCKLHLNTVSLQSPTHKFLVLTRGKKELFHVCKIILLSIKITCCNHIHCGVMKSEAL